MAIEEGKIKLAITEQAKRLVARLNEEIERGNDITAFLIAISLAGMKDVLDLTLNASLIGLIPIIGQMPGLFLSVFLTLFLLGKGWFLRRRIKIIWWVAGVFLDNLPAFNTLPLNTLTVLYAWRIVRKRANAADDKLKNVAKLTAKEMQGLNANISLLDNTS